jgi:predicted lipid-binding transport protein (Tim44 family)
LVIVAGLAFGVQLFRPQTEPATAANRPAFNRPILARSTSTRVPLWVRLRGLIGLLLVALAIGALIAVLLGGLLFVVGVRLQS